MIKEKEVEVIKGIKKSQIRVSRSKKLEGVEEAKAPKNQYMQKIESLRKKIS